MPHWLEATNDWEGAYTFDQAGNRFGRVANNVNQYANRSYDGNGNQTSDGTWVYAYNALDQLISAIKSDGSAKVTYAYDGQGRRVLKETFADTSGSWVLTSSRKFGYDGTQLIAEYDNTTGTLLRSFTWGIGIGQVGALLSISTYNGNGTVAARYFPYFDGSGNVTGLTDAAGAVVATYEYDPFGNRLSSNGTSAALAANPFGFSTMYFDGETGKYHYPYREYDPADGRWMTRDPAAESGGVNLYFFNQNDPVNNVDPNGLSPIQPLTLSASDTLARGGNFVMRTPGIQVEVTEDGNSAVTAYFETKLGLRAAGVGSAHAHWEALRMVFEATVAEMGPEWNNPQVAGDIKWAVDMTLDPNGPRTLGIIDYGMSAASPIRSSSVLEQESRFASRVRSISSMRSIAAREQELHEGALRARTASISSPVAEKTAPQMATRSSVAKPVDPQLNDRA